MKFNCTGLLLLIFSNYTFSGEANMSDDPNDLFGRGTSPNEDPLSTVNTFSLGEEKLADLIEKSKGGDKNAAFKVYEFYEFSEYERAKADHWLETAATLGHSTAQYTFSLDLFTNEKYADALTWCEKAIENGHLKAQSFISRIKEKF